jgi:hypothetical protein
MSFMDRLQRIRRFLTVGLAASMLMAFGAVPLFAASEGSVDATVTAVSACITVEAASVDFGANEFSTGPDVNGDVVAVGTPDTVGTTGASYGLSNCSAGESAFLASGTDAENGDASVTWALDATGFLNGICQDTDGATDRYRMDVVLDAANDDDPTGDPGTFLTTSAQVLNGLEAVAPASGPAVLNRIVMPCTGSGGAGEPMSSTITYTATLN